MKIAITLNEVVRSYNEQLLYIYDKYRLGEPTIDKSEEIIDIDKLETYLPIEDNDTVGNLDDLMFRVSSLEIGGHAKTVNNENVQSYNEFVSDFLEFEGNSVTLVSVEYYRSISATLFFLSKINILLREFRVYDYYDTIWNDYDVIITAEPSIIDSVPDNKTVIKINASYNKNNKTTHEYDTLSEVFESGILKTI